jgi:hypothetical protein
MTNVNTPILNLPIAISIDGSEVVPIVQGGTTKRATVDQITGAATEGIPAGGLTGQALIKDSATDYDASWQALNLALSDAITGTLPTTNGGTGLATYTQGDLLYSSAADTLAKLAKDTNATRYLSNTGASNNPAWAQVDLSNGVTGNLPVTNLAGGSGASGASFWRGDGTWATPAGAGTVTGPVSSTDLAIVRWDLASGTIIQDSTVLMDDTTGTTYPATNDSGALGKAAQSWSDLFLASGGVINWDNGDVTITHAANALHFAGASSGYTFDAAITPSANDGAAIGASGTAWSDLFIASGGVINWNAGDVTITHAANQITFAGATSGYLFGDGPVAPATSDGAALGTTALMWSDLFLASAGVINFGNGEVLITAAPNDLGFTGAANGYQFDANVKPTANDVASLGISGTAWSDLFLASGGVINWNAGDITLTHSANLLTFDGGALKVGSGNVFYLYNAAESANAGIYYGASGLTISFNGADEILATGSALSPATSDGNALGTTSLMWSDLFLASGGVINWNNGDVTITHAANALTFAGAETYTYNVVATSPIVLGNLDSAATYGVISLNNSTVDATLIGFAGGGDANNLFHYAPVAHYFRIAGNDEAILTASALSPAASDGLALGTTALMWSDLFLASGGVINFNNGDVTITHSLNTLTIAGGILAVPASSTINGVVIAQTTQVFDEYVYVETVADQDYDIMINCSFGGTINEITTDCLSGTCTLTGKINTTALGGTANSVSTTEQTQAHASANVFVAGDNIRLTISANSACLDMSVKIKYTRTLA